MTRPRVSAIVVAGGTLVIGACGGGTAPEDATPLAHDAGLLAQDAGLDAPTPLDAPAPMDAPAPLDAGGAMDAMATAFDASGLDVPAPDDADRSVDVRPIDVGAAPGCVSVPLAPYTGAFDRPPIAVAAREAAGGWTVVSTTSATSTSVHTSTLTGTPGPNSVLLDETGLSSVAAAAELAMHAMPGADDVRVFATIDGRVLGWTGTGGPAHLVATGQVLASARLGADSIVAVREAGRPIVLRLGSTGAELPATVAEDRGLGLADAGDGALVALAQGSLPDACQLLALDASGAPRTSVDVATGAGPCDAVAVADLGGGLAGFAYVAGGELWYRQIDVAAGSVASLAALGPAIPGHLAVWPDGAGGVRAVWRSAPAELRSVAVSPLLVAGETSCLTGPATIDWDAVASARQGATTIVLAQGGGRSGDGLQYVTLADR